MFSSRASVLYSALLIAAVGVVEREAFTPVGGGVARLSRTGRTEDTTSWARTATRIRRRTDSRLLGRLGMSVADEHDILLRVAKGEKAERAPVWLMRQVTPANCPLETTYPML